MSKSRVLLILGRDGMGDDANEADFDAWVDYVCDNIAKTSGVNSIAIEERRKSDVQSDDVLGADDDAHSVRYALQTLWERFCADTTLWPVRSEG